MTFRAYSFELPRAECPDPGFRHVSSGDSAEARAILLDKLYDWNVPHRRGYSTARELIREQHVNTERQVPTLGPEPESLHPLNLYCYS